jgi:ABC-type siderophore export system fused ATPase/permease subunit
MDLKKLDNLHQEVDSLKVQGLMFAYEPEDEEHEKGFAVGPIDFEVKKGEALFIIGGNGSGKTTIAKLITGLYTGDKGSIKINNVEIDNTRIGEYFSTIYSNYHLFKKIYGVDIDGKEPEIQKYLKILNLEEKVQLNNGSFSTLDLSGGQRKRLALMQCCLEDRPIYLFDEVAADQDPEFRRFFYREMLTKMKQKGKIVIAITHDDHYFDVADKIIKMDMGKISSQDISDLCPGSQE